MTISILDDLFKKIYSSEIEIKFINGDDVNRSHFSIGDEILNVRLGQDGDKPYNGPIIVYGFNSLDSILRREIQKYPLLLVSPGVSYLKIPCSLDLVINTISKATQFSISDEFLNVSLKDSILGKQQSRIESVLAHQLGNFLGSEKLLYGAYINGMEGVNKEYFEQSLKRIQNAQNEALKYSANALELYVYRLGQNNYVDQEINPRSDTSSFSGKILYIDDHAHIGWADGVTIALGGKLLNEKPEMAKLNNVEFEKRKTFNKIETWTFVQCQDVDKYYQLISTFVSKDDNLKEFDVILLDLRLKGKLEENIDETNLEKLSGYLVLQAIRKANPVIPVLMLTASRKAKNMEGLLENGADAYFVKEIITHDETYDEIRSYHQRFRRRVKELIDKSYLTMIWRILQNNKKKLDTEIIKCLISAIALLKKSFSKAEQKYFNISVYNEVVLNIGLARAILDGENEEDAIYKSRNLDNHKDPYITKPSKKLNTFDKGCILRELRNCVAHEKEPLTETDAKIALYAFFRMCPFASEIKWSDFLSQLNISGPQIAKVEPQNQITFLKNVFRIVCGINFKEDVTINILGKNVGYFKGILALNRYLIDGAWSPNWQDIKMMIYIYEEMCRKKLPQTLPLISEISRD